MDPETKASRLSSFISVLIAIVSIVGALIAWRVALASSAAGNADTAGLLATVAREDVETRATILLYGHLTAYASYVGNRTLADTYDALARGNPQRTDYAAYAHAFRLAANYALYMIPSEYIDRNKELEVARDRGETIARESLDTNLDSRSNFDEADKARVRVQLLLINLILLGGALLFLTLADAIQNFLRYLFLLAGIGSFLIGTFGALFIELLFPIVRL
ncbi:MAG TPA: hypothetical protein VIX58_13835 [Anaerolineae bacterium]